jgi:hypothetical protein
MALWWDPGVHGCIEPIHQASVCVSECMKPAVPNPEGLQERAQLPFHHEILIPRRSVLGGENQIQQVRPPRRKVRMEMGGELRRDGELPNRVRCFWV